MVLNDEGFKFSSSRAAEALSMAEELIAWCQDKAHKELFTLFAHWLVGALKTCFDVPSRTARLRSEKIWEQYHTLRISKPLKEEWDKFLLTSLCQPALPTFYQYISCCMFNSLLELELKFTEINQKNKSEATCLMTLEEIYDLGRNL